MSIHITKNRICATGNDANGLLIAMSSDESLIRMATDKTGSESFQAMVNEAIAARGIGHLVPPDYSEGADCPAGNIVEIDEPGIE